MIEYEVQRARAVDWQRIRAIRLRALADTPDAFGTTLAQDEARPDSEWQSRAKNDDVAHFLAISSDQDSVGLAVGAPYTGYTDAAGLFGMWVAPEVRCHSVGRALVQAVIAWARDENYRCVLLDVGDTNAAAIRLYESCGFVRTGKTGSLPAPRQHIREHQRLLSLA